MASAKFSKTRKTARTPTLPKLETLTQHSQGIAIGTELVREFAENRASDQYSMNPEFRDGPQTNAVMAAVQRAIGNPERLRGLCAMLTDYMHAAGPTDWNCYIRYLKPTSIATKESADGPMPFDMDSPEWSRVEATFKHFGWMQPPAKWEVEPFSLIWDKLQLDRAGNALSDINGALVSMRQLAIMINGSQDQEHAGEDEAYKIAIRSCAETAALKCDVVSGLLGDPGFGSMAEEFAVKRVPMRGADETTIPEGFGLDAVTEKVHA